MRCQPVGGGVCYKSCDAFMEPEFFLVGNRARNGVANVIAFKNLLLWKTVSKKLLWQQTIADFIQPICM